jgi:hypothetical protein
MMIGPSRALLTGVAVLGLAKPTPAQTRPSTVTMSCAQATALVRMRGALVLGTGGQTYDRFVSDTGHCESGQAARPAFRPTQDRPSCFIGYTCFDPSGSRGGG